MAVTEAGHHASRWYGDHDGCLHLNGATFYVDGTTTNNNIVLTDNLADALNIKEGSNSYLKFVTTNSGEKIVAGKAVELATTLTFNGATGVNKILMQDNLASGLVIGEAANAYVTFVTTNSSEASRSAKRSRWPTRPISPSTRRPARRSARRRGKSSVSGMQRPSFNKPRRRKLP